MIDLCLLHQPEDGDGCLDLVKPGDDEIIMLLLLQLHLIKGADVLDLQLFHSLPVTLGLQ
ncbi:hypothetical protein D3C81_1772040 [compost metagenome]